MARIAAYIFFSVVIAWIVSGLVWPNSVDWGDTGIKTFEVKDNLELASNRALWNPDSLQLVCTSKGDVRLVLLTKLPIPSEFFIARDDATIFVGATEHKLIIKEVDRIRWKDADTMFTRSLLASELESLIDWLGSSPPRRISFMTQETSTVLVGRVKGSEVRAISDSCTP